MIKAYWPELADPIDRIAAKRMPESRLVALGVRAALTSANDSKVASGLNISAMRAIANGTDPRTERIRHFITERLQKAP